MITDLRKLRHVVEVARAGSFTAAAAVLAISQSALTKSVADVEHRLDLKLFQRLSRGVKLTEAGQRFVARAERILADTEDLMSRMGELRDLESGRLRLGVAPASFVIFLEGAVSAFARAHPGITIEVIDGTADEIAQRLIAGELDLAAGSANFLDQHTELAVEKITALHHFFIARRGHPVTRQKRITAEALLQYPLVMPSGLSETHAQLARAYAAAGVTPQAPRYRCDHFPLVLRIVEETDAISPVVSLAPSSESFRSRFAVFEDVVALDVQTLGLAAPKRREQPPAAEAFAADLRAMRG
jgi:DNA-binding transcriptional LysR family regulator